MLQTAFEMAGAVRRQGSTIGAAGQGLSISSSSMERKLVNTCSCGLNGAITQETLVVLL